MILTRYNKLSDYIKRHYKTLVPFLTLYKTINIALAFSEMKLRKINCMSRPFMYRIDPCSLCNLRCVSCTSYKRKTNEKRVMDLEDYKLIIDKISKYALRTSLYDLGEPLLNKNIYNMIRYSYDNGISTLISTNFNLFRNEDLEKLFSSYLTVLEPCLDGYTQNKYAEYRCGGDVQVVKNGIRMVLEHKHKKKLKWPLVDVQVVMFDHIKDELPMIDRFLKTLRTDKITYRAESLGYNAQETTIWGKPITSDSPCFWLYFVMTIGPDGNVYPCSGRSTSRIPVGNILKEDIGDIWNNKYYKFARSLYSGRDDLPFNDEMLKLPCYRCNEFRKKKKMKKK